MQEGQTEYVSFDTMLEEIGVPGDVRSQMTTQAEEKPEREPVPGQKLSRHRVQVSFVFDITANSEPIINSHNDEDVQGYNLALLKQFLIADKAKLLEMLVYQAAIELGLNSCESFIDMFLPDIDYSSGNWEHHLFGPAIEQLEGANAEYWRNIWNQPPEKGIGDILSLCTEKLLECFKSDFVDSSYELIGESNE